MWGVIKLVNHMLSLIKDKLAKHEPRELMRHMAEGMPEAGVLIPIISAVDSPRIILTQRAANLSTHRGEVAFPGGKMDESDESLEFTALREAQEEIGLEPSLVKMVGAMGPVVSRFGIKVTPYVGLVPEDVESSLTPNEGEIANIFSVPISFFLEGKRLRTDEISFRGATLFIPAYEYDGFHIWGLTAIMLSEFLNTVFDAGIDLTKAPESGELKTYP